MLKTISGQRGTGSLFHLLNNRLFKVSLLAETLQLKIKSESVPDPEIIALAKSIQAAVHEVAESAQDINDSCNGRLG